MSDDKDQKKENAVYRMDFRVTLGSDRKTVLDQLEAFKNRLIDLIGDLADDYVYQLELGELGSYHLQGYLKLKKKERVSTFKHDFILHWSPHSVHVAPISRLGELALKNYVMKKDTRILGPWGKREIYTGSDLKHQIQFYPWQTAVWDFLSGPVNEREINWVYDPAGNTGKSMLCKKVWYEKNSPALVYGSASNLTNLIFKAPTSKIYLFDLTRAKPKDISGQDIYSVMESLKNGVIVNTKYENGQKLFNPPHVWIFANILPKFQSLTADRWKVWTIDDAKELKKWVPDPKEKISADTNIEK